MKPHNKHIIYNYLISILLLLVTDVAPVAGQKTLTVSITPAASGTVTANGTAITSGVGVSYSDNQVVSLAATPASGYGFLRWTINGTERQTENPYSITMSEDKNVLAHFGTATCSSTTFEDASLSTSYTDNSFSANNDTWNALQCRLNTNSSYAHAGSKSIRMKPQTGFLISPLMVRPTSFSFYARMYDTSKSTTVKVYISTDGGVSYNATPIYTATVSGASFVQHSITLNSNSNTVRLKIENAASSTSDPSYCLMIDDATICIGPEMNPPTVTFSPVNGGINVEPDQDLTITSDEKLYRYISTTGALIPIAVNDPAFTNADTLATLLSLTKVSDNTSIPFTVNINAAGTLITVNPSSNLDYEAIYKLSLRNIADSNGNVFASTKYSQFTIKSLPTPVIHVEEVSSNETYDNQASFNFGTLYSGSTISKTFRIINTGTLALNINSCSITTGTKFFKTTSPLSSVDPGDTTTFTLVFNPGTDKGTFSDMLSIESNDATTGSYTLLLVGGRADFVLPYTYQSGCTSPIMTDTELKQDYENLSDIPSEITLKNGIPIDASHFYTAYKVFLGEGNCMPSGSSVLKVGEKTNGLELNLPNCGEIILKWCSNGYRKVKITDDDDNVYEMSPSFLPSCTCYTTSTVVNTPNPVKMHIEFIGNDSSLLTTLYYLQITPYNASIQSSAKNIVEFSTGIAGETVKIYDNVILASVPEGINLSHITPSIIKASPFASVSPLQGLEQDFSSGAKTYTVTAQNGTTKTYTVSIDHDVNYGTNKYVDSIAITVPMNRDDKKLEVLEIKNASCQVPVSGNGSNYTIYFLDPTDMPAEGYKISGPSEICIGSIATYTMSNAPMSNNPSYSWHLSGADKDLFTILGDTIGKTLRVKAPDVVTKDAVDFSVDLEFNPSNCEILRGKDTLQLNVTKDSPEPISGLTAGCACNGLLTLTALGSNDATSYNWTFSPSMQIVAQNNNAIILNIGQTNADITAQVNTQNGCGITMNYQNYDIPYANQETRWTGGTDNDWSKNINWDKRKPKACTNVTIPDVGNGVAYPIIGSEGGECNKITFEPGGAVLGLQKLSYNKAYVQLELRRMKWYTITAPLKSMFSGDYYFNGAPRTQMKLFDDVNPDYLGTAAAVGTWTNSFANLTVGLTPGRPYAYLVDTFSFHYPNPATYEKDDVTLYFPRQTAAGDLLTAVIPYGANGKLYPSLTQYMPKDSTIAFRFAMENSSNQLENIYVPIKQGLNLIGNPLMTHLDFKKLYAANSGKISNKVKFWNGTTFTTYMVGPDITSDMNLTSTIIPPMQSFFVEGLNASDNLFIDLENHFVTDDTIKLRSAKVPPKVLNIKASINGQKSATTIAMSDDAQNSYGDDDAVKLFTQFQTVPEVYTLADNKTVDINQFSSLPYMVPVGIKTSSRGNIALQFAGAEKFEGVDVTLLNTLTGEQQNLKVDNKYNLDYDGTATDGSLFVEFRTANTTTNTPESQACTLNRCIQVFSRDKNIITAISPNNENIKKMTIWEEGGKQLFNKGEINATRYDATLNTGCSICVVRIETINRTYVIKVLISK